MVKCLYIYPYLKPILMIILNGVHECKLDSKGRIMLPSSFRKKLLPVLDQGFIIKKSVHSLCLELHPIKEWNKEMKKLSYLNRYQKKNEFFIRKFTDGVKEVDIDSAGRLLIPKDLLGFALIDLTKKTLTLSASINIIEIWDKIQYEKDLSNDVDFGDLAEEVMGSIKLSNDTIS